jgi:hypothetical protein
MRSFLAASWARFVRKPRSEDGLADGTGELGDSGELGLGRDWGDEGELGLCRESIPLSESTS